MRKVGTEWSKKLEISEISLAVDPPSLYVYISNDELNHLKFLQFL